MAWGTTEPRRPWEISLLVCTCILQRSASREKIWSAVALGFDAWSSILSASPRSEEPSNPVHGLLTLVGHGFEAPGSAAACLWPRARQSPLLWRACERGSARLPACPKVARAARFGCRARLTTRLELQPWHGQGEAQGPPCRRRFLAGLARGFQDNSVHAGLDLQL